MLCFCGMGNALGTESVTSDINKAKQSLLAWGWDWFIDHWPTIFVATIGGGGMAYLASLSAIIGRYGAVGWVGVALASALAIALSLACVGYWRERSALADFARKSTLAVKTNPLSPVHRYELIQMGDFFHPFYKPIQNVRFEDCDLMGPAYIYSEGGTFDRCGFEACEIVIVRTDRNVTGGIHLMRPVLVNCRLYRITFLMAIDQYNAMPDAMKRGLPVISDGRIGNI